MLLPSKLVRALLAILAVVNPPLPAWGQTSNVTYHDLAGMTTWMVGNMKLRGAMGDSGSFLIGEMPPGAPGLPGSAGHHHEQEQIYLGVSGSTIAVIGGSPYRLGSYGAVVPPSNSDHYHINGTVSGNSTFIEFQPVLRRDWFPPHPAYNPSKSAAPVAAPREPRLFADLSPSSVGWTGDATGARMKSLAGKTIRITMWDLSTPTSAAELKPNGERFVFVLEGHVEMTSESAQNIMTPEMLAIVSAAKDARLRSLGKGRTLVAVFERVVN